MNDSTLRARLVRLAHTRPEFRAALLPLLRRAGDVRSPEYDAAINAYAEFNTAMMAVKRAQRQLAQRMAALASPYQAARPLSKMAIALTEVDYQSGAVAEVLSTYAEAT
jgi:hypothetical protein